MTYGKGGPEQAMCSGVPDKMAAQPKPSIIGEFPEVAPRLI